MPLRLPGRTRPRGSRLWGRGEGSGGCPAQRSSGVNRSSVRSFTSCTRNSVAARRHSCKTAHLMATTTHTGEKVMSQVVNLMINTPPVWEVMKFFAKLAIKVSFLRNRPGPAPAAHNKRPSTQQSPYEPVLLAPAVISCAVHGNLLGQSLGVRLSGQGPAAARDTPGGCNPTAVADPPTPLILHSRRTPRPRRASRGMSTKTGCSQTRQRCGGLGACVRAWGWGGCMCMGGVHARMGGMHARMRLQAAPCEPCALPCLHVLVTCGPMRPHAPYTKHAPYANHTA